MYRTITIARLALLLGITPDGALKLAKSLGIGEKRGGMWWVSEEEVETAKANSRTYLLSRREI